MLSNMALKMSSVVKQLMYVKKLFRVTAGSFHSFQILCMKKHFGSLTFLLFCCNFPLEV